MIAKSLFNTSTTAFLACDEARSVLAVQRKGSVTCRAYTSYGALPDEKSIESRIGFQGQLYEHSHGAYMLGNGHRLFSPQLMRFIRPDRLSPFKDKLTNSYCFALNTPPNLKDPSGKTPEEVKRIKHALKIETELKYPKPLPGHIYLGKETYAYMDTSKGLRRLNLVGHGAPGVMEFGGVRKNAEQAVSILQKAGIALSGPNAPGQIRVLSCFSGYGGESAFAAKIA